MFGYIKPDLPYLYIKDSVLYRSMYCSLCKSIGEHCGAAARALLSYDIAFLSTLFHNIAGEDVEINDENCILHPIVKRPIATRDKITESAAYLNVFFAYYKLADDIEDLGRGKFKRLFFNKGFKRAFNASPELEKTIKDNYKVLLDLEKKNCDSIDMAADPFGLMISRVSEIVLDSHSNEWTKKLCYSLGKWVYLIDALDDYDRDIKKKNYNVFYNYYKCKNFEELLSQNEEELSGIFNIIFAGIAESLQNIKFHFNSDLTDNILLKGLPSMTKKIMKREKKKCKKIHTKF